MKNAPREGGALELQSDRLNSTTPSTPCAAPSIPQATDPAERVVAHFWKNRRGESIRVVLKTYEGHNLIDVRQCCTGSDGKIRLTKKGVSISVLRLPELAAAINKAVKVAHQNGLLREGAP